MSEEQLIVTPSVFGETGNFLLERELGAGGMGGVYLGRDKMLDRPIAVKVMLKEYGADPEFVEKFKKEAQASARLIHPNIAQVYSYGICDGMPYIVMELVAGGSLGSLMKNTPGNTDIQRVIKLCEQTAQALRTAADQGFVHGDIKPDNILLDANGNAKLVDFGLAAMQKDTDEIWGTPYYIAPEKVRKEVVDFRSDMYNLGGTLYHALTGVAPFEGVDATAVVRKRFEVIPLKPSEIRPELSPQIDDLVMRMLAFNPADRFPSFEALLEEFHKVMSTGLSPTKQMEKPTEVKKAVSAKTASGTKKIMIKPKKRFKLNTTGENLDGDIPPPNVPSIDKNDEEEDDGNIVAKALLAVGGGIAVIAIIFGLIFWSKSAGKAGEKARLQQQIDAGVAELHSTIAKNKVEIEEYAKKFEDFARTGEKVCLKLTEDMKGVLPEEFNGQLKPELSAELLSAIASTNVVAVDTNLVATSQGANSVAAASTMPVSQTVAAAAKVPKFRDPVGDEADPMSPEGEKYLKEKKAWQEEIARLAEEKAKAPKEDASGQEPKREETPTKDGALDFSEVIAHVHELWNRAYSCEAAIIRMNVKFAELTGEIDQLLTVNGADKDTLAKLQDTNNQIIAKFEILKGAEDIKNVRKNIGVIENRADKLLRQTKEKIRIKKLEDERAKAAADEAIRKAAEEARRIKEREELVAKEQKAAKDKFAAFVNTGNFHHLDWRSTARQMNTLKESAQTGEGAVAAGDEISKIEAMKLVHDIFIKHIKGYTFKKKGLRKWTVEDVNERQIVIVGENKKRTVIWSEFYKKFRTNLNELINTFIVKRDVSKLSLLDWSDAMLGSALTMRLICMEEATASNRAIELTKQAVKEFPSCLKKAKMFFPELDFSDVEIEE